MIDMDDSAVRCGYSRCRAPLPPPGPQGGRRRTFCRNTRWDGDRTCAQMARAERDALDALGLDSSRTAFALDAERLRSTWRRCARRWSAGSRAGRVTSRLTEVEAHAVSAVEAANRRAADAEAERLAAQEAQEWAEGLARRAKDQAERAGKERPRPSSGRRRPPARHWAPPRSSAPRAAGRTVRRDGGGRDGPCGDAEREVRAAQLVAAQAAATLAAERERTRALDAELAAARRAVTVAEGERDSAAAQLTAAAESRDRLAAERNGLADRLATAVAERDAAVAERDAAAAERGHGGGRAGRGGGRAGRGGGGWDAAAASETWRWPSETWRWPSETWRWPSGTRRWPSGTRRWRAGRGGADGPREGNATMRSLRRPTSARRRRPAVRRGLGGGRGRAAGPRGGRGRTPAGRAGPGAADRGRDPGSPGASSLSDVRASRRRLEIATSGFDLGRIPADGNLAATALDALHRWAHAAGPRPQRQAGALGDPDHIRALSPLRPSARLLADPYRGGRDGQDHRGAVRVAGRRDRGPRRLRWHAVRRLGRSATPPRWRGTSSGSGRCSTPASCCSAARPGSCSQASSPPRTDDFSRKLTAMQKLVASRSLDHVDAGRTPPS
jgi:hypothetical protein